MSAQQKLKTSLALIAITIIIIITVVFSPNHFPHANLDYSQSKAFSMVSITRYELYEVKNKEENEKEEEAK